jgi:cobalamin biosynthetic protein CobC
LSTDLQQRLLQLLHHGGRVRTAAARYNIPLAQWLDLSTGINPNGWPVAAIPAALWSRLPEEDDGLEQAARDYYGAEHLLPVAGSQAAIQALPQLRAASRVAVLNPAYAEHAHAWQRAGHAVTAVAADGINTAIAAFDVVVLINPNNPTGARFHREQLLHWHEQLAARNGWLVVDEAFMDCTPEQSLCYHTSVTGLIVLRSLGKFFGLAGARVGFVCAEPSLLAQLNSLLGPWTINAPARHVATQALQDREWQREMRQQLHMNGARLHALLGQHGFSPGGCALFQWLHTPQAEELHEQLAQKGILTRLFTEPASVRVGLPKDEQGWQRLDVALAHSLKNHDRFKCRVG